MFLLNFCSVLGQNVSLYNQFNGKIDFTFIGNSMNLGENNVTDGCEDLTLTSSSATLNLAPTQIIERAYLYWAGSGTGDFKVKLNGVAINATRTFARTHPLTELEYFSGFADVTSQIIATGNSVYTLSDLDITQTLINSPYCVNRTDFAGWAILIVYQDASLPINQVNIYDGLQSIPDEINITLDAIDVIDNIGAKIAFLAWEGDQNLEIQETLSFNNTLLSNSLNPPNNQFNGTNTFAGTSDVYNMDIDEYDIQNLINIGDTSATIKMTSGRDFVMINAIVTKLNSQLPDATISYQNVVKYCNSRTITVDYTVYNINSNNALPTHTPIAVYVNNQLVGQAITQAIIPINGSENGQITITIPNTIPIDFQLKFVVDDNGTGQGVRVELDETNNDFSGSISLIVSPSFNALETVISCNQGLTKGIFDFSNYADLVKFDPNDVVVGFYQSLSDAENQINPIFNLTSYRAETTPKEIFIRIKNNDCYSITSFLLVTKNCPPTVYNYVSANNDDANETFHIDGLRDVFLNHNIEIYNRWGKLVWTGTNDSQEWDGYANSGFRFDNKKVPIGTYYYIIYLNDPDYLNPIVGWLYFGKSR